MTGRAVPPLIDVRRSWRRSRTVSAYRDGDTVVVLIPANFSRAEEQEWVVKMVQRIDRAERRRRPDDEALVARAKVLSQRHLDGRAKPTSVRWVANQNSRWGSCTPADGTIRLSDRLQGMPSYVVDYVLLHELAHLLTPGHGDRFWTLVEGYERLERARGYLEGVAASSGLPMAEDVDYDETGGAQDDAAASSGPPMAADLDLDGDGDDDDDEAEARRRSIRR